jgi:DNA-binding response OmpR family regulator/nitrogen-specific signal transduction histidine kinase
MQELDHLKSRFFANISHEFRTPLTLLMGPINDLLKNRSELKEDDRKLLKIMKRNAVRLQQLINQLLDLSKLETGNLKLEVSEGNLTGFIRIIILSFISLAESKHIKYEYDLAETDQKLYFDSDKVEKIITNLISNALKFTPGEGYVMVMLRYWGEKNISSGQNITAGKNIGSGSYVEIKVRDTGPGIPDNEKEKIFSRFYQVSSSDSREHEGSGIGLALVRELVDLYRGEIFVESEISKGSTFTVTLPVSMEQFREGEIVAVSEKPFDTKSFDDQKILAEGIAEPAVQKETAKEKEKDLPIILIVEDNTDLRGYISDNLMNQYQILEAENGREGLDKAIESIPDLVVSDLMMPEMDGMEMCDSLKKDTRTNHIPLIMLTAKADRESKLEGLETGADDYIIKPFDAEELQVRVKNLIEQRKKLREKYRTEFLMDPAGSYLHDPSDEFLSRLIECTKKHLDDPEFSVTKLGEELNMSHMQLYRKVRSLTDYTPNEYIRNTRLKAAARMFLEGTTNITSVLYTVGYNSPSYFTESFRELFGMNPSEYIKHMGRAKD